MASLIGQTLGNYQILERLGEGGMATVYKALDTRLQRQVAVKVLLPLREHSEKFLKRFDREAKNLARLSHPNIVNVIDYGDADGLPYLVMAYLPGGTLRERMAVPLPWQEALSLILPIAHAIQYTHSHGIVHRDIKPANILLTESGQPMLTDFGIAKLLEARDATELTGTGLVIGTLEYMAPEQFINRDIDERCDVYSLGVVIYEMITGRKPYQADTAIEVIWKQASTKMIQPSDLVPALPKQVEDFLLRSLARNASDRFPTMTSMINTMEAIFDRLDPGRRAKYTRRVRTRKITEEDELSDERTVDIHTHKRALLLAYRIFNNLKISGFIILLLAIGVVTAAYYFGTLGQGPLSALATLTATWTPNVTSSPTITPSPTMTPSPTKEPTAVGPIESGAIEQVQVPQGEFIMGSDPDEGYQDCQKHHTGCQSKWFFGEDPKHTVYLDTFLIDRIEVTNAMYAMCVGASACTKPDDFTDIIGKYYYSESNYANYPVVNITWYDARSYCLWSGGRLPSEAEWEKAARGTDQRWYPWGNGSATCEKANFWFRDTGCSADLVVGGTLHSGASPYGVLDMAGNVWEWVSDWYNASYYSVSPAQNPTGPPSGEYRVIRGGARNNIEQYLRTTGRMFFHPNETSPYIGFRCVR